MGKITKFIASLLSSTGNVSLTRVITLITAFDILCIYTAQNVASMFNNGAYVDFPTNTVTILLVVMGAKVAQKPFEEKDDKKKKKKS